MNDDGPVVVVIRLSEGDVIAILNGEVDGVLRVEHPYYVMLNSTRNQLMITPYCALSDEIYYEIPRSSAQFVVTASSSVARIFFETVDSHELQQTHEAVVESQEYDEIEATVLNRILAPGNDTKH